MLGRACWTLLWHSSEGACRPLCLISMVGMMFSYISSTLTSLSTILQNVSRAILQNHTSDTFPSPYHLLVQLTWFDSLSPSDLDLCGGSTRTVIGSVISRTQCSHISGQQEDFEHSWFEGMGLNKKGLIPTTPEASGEN